MEFFVIGIGALFAIGIGIALYEWRKGKVLLKHDLRLNSQTQTESQRETIRSEEAVRTRMWMDHLQ